MILQNFLAVVIIRIYAGDQHSAKSFKSVLTGILANPVILSAMAGIVVALSEIRMPEIIDRSLKILSGMALPLALLLIGASLSFDLIRHKFFPSLLSSFLKLFALPAFGLALYSISGTETEDFLPGLILLAAPSATLVYVMALELKSDAEFAVANISLSTLLSALTYSFWIMIAS
jgi:predicted permease